MGFFKLITLAVLLITVPSEGAMCELLKGNIDNKSFEVIYADPEKKIEIIFEERKISVSLTGYTATDFFVSDLNDDGNDEILFLDLSGLSAGGSLVLLVWDENDFVEPFEDKYFANSIELSRVKGKSYILLKQHQTEDLYEISNVLAFVDSELIESKSHYIWEFVISEYYCKKLTKNTEDWKKSRYYSYIGNAYMKIGENEKARDYYLRAKELDKTNDSTSR